MRLWLLLLLVPSIVFGQAGSAGDPSHVLTPCLKLEYGNYEYENYNWNRIDKSVCNLAFQCSNLDECNLCPLITDCAPACIPLDGACTNSGQCCEGFCSEGTCITAGTCSVTTCGNNIDCCSAFCVDGMCGTPGCVANGGVCLNPADCCSGFCDSGTCGSTTTTSTVTTTSTSTSSSSTSSSSSTTTSTSSSTTTSTSTLPAPLCLKLDPALAEDDHYMFPFIAPAGIELTKVSCYCEGGCAPGYVVQLQDRGGDVINVSTGAVTPNVACSSDPGAGTWYTIDPADADRLIATGMSVYASIITAPTTVDRETVCVQYHYQ